MTVARPDAERPEEASVTSMRGRIEGGGLEGGGLEAGVLEAGGLEGGGLEGGGLKGPGGRPGTWRPLMVVTLAPFWLL